MSQSIQFNSKSVRNSVNRSLCRRTFLLISLALVCFTFLPTAQAVTPPPDGGYGGSNTVEGTDAFFSLTTGVWNSAFGHRALFKDTTGFRNTAVGYEALYNNNGRDNVALGANALFSNTTGIFNIAIGSYALYGNTTGSNNIAIGTTPCFALVGAGTRLSAILLQARRTLYRSAENQPLMVATQWTLGFGPHTCTLTMTFPLE